MTGMVERVARAQCAAFGLDPNYQLTDPKTGKVTVQWQLHEKMARAAIMAMREPTDAMGHAGLIADGDWPDENRAAAFAALGDIGWGDRLAGNPSKWKKPMWRAMIDAAIADKSS